MSLSEPLGFFPLPSWWLGAVDGKFIDPRKAAQFLDEFAGIDAAFAHFFDTAVQSARAAAIASVTSGSVAGIAEV